MMRRRRRLTGSCQAGSPETEQALRRSLICRNERIQSAFDRFARIAKSTRVSVARCGPHKNVRIPDDLGGHRGGLRVESGLLYVVPGLLFVGSGLLFVGSGL